MEERINNTLQLLNKSIEDLEGLCINMEIIDNSNTLIYDKLEAIEDISKKRNLTSRQIILNQFNIERNNDCYMTLNYVIKREVQNINNVINNIYSNITKAKEILENIEEKKNNE